MKEADLAAYENCEIPLTGFSNRKEGRGRPREIEDDALRRALTDLQFVLEQNWGLIGWELQQATTQADIRAAFSAITGFNCPRLDVFRRRPTQRTTSSSLRKLRRELANVQAESRKTYAEVMQSQESAE